MAKDVPVLVDLPDDLLLALGRAARTVHCSPSDYLKAALSAALDRTADHAGPSPAGIALALALSRDWVDLQSRLRAQGLVLRLRSAEFWLCDWPFNNPLLPAAEAGLALADLVARFRAPFPGALHVTGTLPTPAQRRA